MGRLDASGPEDLPEAGCLQAIDAHFIRQRRSRQACVQADICLGSLHELNSICAALSVDHAC